jgi:hypothetical protein
VSNFSHVVCESDNHVLTRLALIWIKPVGMSALGVRRDKAALSSGCKPTRQPLQPEAIGAVMATKWLKPSISVSRIGGSASVQAATRVNAEQAWYGAFSVNADFVRAPVIF